jgi:putative ABC transport system permease protein
MIWRRRALQTLDLDVADHLDRETAENIERGMDPQAARYAALRAFGNVTRLKEETRAVWSWIWLEQLLQDLRYAGRMLRRNPGFSATAVLTLALGIGMNTAMFSVVDAVILQPLPYPNPERLVWISDDCKGPLSDGDCGMSRADFALWKATAQSFEKMALVGHEDVALVFNGNSETNRVGSIQGDFWSITNAQPILGHLFRDDEPNSVVLTWPLFQRTFNGNPGALGKSIELEGHSFTVTGVLTPKFRNLIPQRLYGGEELRDIDAYIPTPAGHELPGDPLRETAQSGPTSTWFRIVGKRKPDVSYEQARAEMDALFYRTWKQYPNLYAHDPQFKDKFRFQTLTERLIGKARPTLTILFGAVAFVLLIAVANIANLLLARASTREREIAIRAAVGAGRARVIRQFLAESVLLALLGGTAGVALAAGSLAIIQRVGSPALPRLEDAHIATSVMLFALLVSLATGVLFGLAPALTFARRDLDEVLKLDARSSSASAGQLRVRGVLVAMEVALAMVLLISAGLMLKSFQRMTSYPPGLNPDRILTMRVSLAGPHYDRQWPHQAVYLQELFTRLGKLPGVDAFGIDCGQFNQPLQVVGVRPPTSDGSGGGAVRYVSPGYLKALGMPLLAGRWPTADEMLDDALVNESFVRKVAGGANVVGRRVKGSFLGATIAGVVADFKDVQLDVESTPQVFTAYQMMPVMREVRIALRTARDPLAIAETVSKSVSGIDKNVPVFQVQTLSQELSNSVAARRFNLALLAIFAGTAVLLATIGIYGVIAYLVAQRTPEIGIRMALGAPRHSILQMVVRQGMRMVLIGIAFGLATAAALTRLMSNMLYGVKSGDPATFAWVSAAIALTALLACVGPALRAAWIDPIVALRNE